MTSSAAGFRILSVPTPEIGGCGRDVCTSNNSPSPNQCFRRYRSGPLHQPFGRGDTTRSRRACRSDSIESGYQCYYGSHGYHHTESGYQGNDGSHGYHHYYGNRTACLSDSLDSESKCEVAELAAESGNSLDDPSTTRLIDQCATALNLTISLLLILSERWEVCVEPLDILSGPRCTKLTRGPLKINSKFISRMDSNSSLSGLLYFKY